MFDYDLFFIVEENTESVGEAAAVPKSRNLSPFFYRNPYEPNQVNPSIFRVFRDGSTR